MVELEDPVRHIAEEVTVVRDDNERARELLEIRLETERRLGVEMVRRLVQKKDIGI